MEYVPGSLMDSKTAVYAESNGLIFGNIGMPEELLLTVLSYVDIDEILKCKLVCKKWNEVIKSHHMWRLKLSHTDVIVKDRISWYVYYYCATGKIFNRNLLKNGNGQLGFKYWNIKANRTDQWIIQEHPTGASPLPENQSEFYGSKRCFASSYASSSKFQDISLESNPVAIRILNELQPKIYVSEWFTGRFYCACKYKLVVQLWNKKGKLVMEKVENRFVEHRSNTQWAKVEIVCENYGPDVARITFSHEGCDVQSWKGHYGSKMAGGVVKILI